MDNIDCIKRQKEKYKKLKPMPTMNETENPLMPEIDWSKIGEVGFLPEIDNQSREDAKLRRRLQDGTLLAEWAKKILRYINSMTTQDAQAVVSWPRQIISNMYVSKYYLLSNIQIWNEAILVTC